MPRLRCKGLRMKEGMGVFWFYPLFLIKSKSFSSCFFFFCSNCITKKWAICNQPFLTELSGKNNLSKPDNKALRWIEWALLSPLHRGEIKPLLVWHPFWCPGRPMWSPLPRNFISLGWGKELGMTDDQCPEEQYMVREHKRFSSSLPVTRATQEVSGGCRGGGWWRQQGRALQLWPGAWRGGARHVCGEGRREEALLQAEGVAGVSGRGWRLLSPDSWNESEGGPRTPDSWAPAVTSLFFLFHYILLWDTEYVLYSRTLLLIYFINSTLCPWIPNSWFIPAPAPQLSSSLITTLVSMSVSLFLFCIYVHLYYILDSIYRWYPGICLSLFTYII